MNLNILYLGAFATQDLIDKYPTSGLDTYKVSEFLLRALKDRKDINLDVITSPDLFSWPKFPVFFLNSHSNAENKTQLVSSLNLPLIKIVWTVVTMFFASASIIRRNKGVTNVVVPYMVYRHALTARLLKRVYREKVKIITIVPDIFFPTSCTAKWFNKKAEIMTRKSDAFVLYTSAMSEYLEITEKPFIVMEGVLDVSSIPCYERIISEKIVLLYTGALHPSHDVMKLIDIIKSIENPNIELWISGKGILYNDIAVKSKQDSRIKFFGTIEKSKVFELQAKADILINPRSDQDGDFLTKYMFPSKVMEYMYSGNPAVVCKMSGIPQEYYNYLVVPADNSVSEIVKSINEVISWTSVQRKEFGEKAKSFIKNVKNADAQTDRIVKLINSLY